MKSISKIIIIIFLSLFASITFVETSFVLENKDNHNVEDPFPEEQDFSIQIYWYDFTKKGNTNSIFINYYLQSLKDDADISDITQLSVDFIAKDDPTKEKEVSLWTKSESDVPPFISDSYNDTEPIDISDEDFFTKGESFTMQMWWQEKNDGGTVYRSLNSQELIIPIYDIPEVINFSQIYWGYNIEKFELRIKYDEEITDFKKFGLGYFYSTAVFKYTAVGRNEDHSILDPDLNIKFDNDMTKHEFVYVLTINKVAGDNAQSLELVLQYNEKNINIHNVKNMLIKPTKREEKFSAPIFEEIPQDIIINDNVNLKDEREWTTKSLKFNINHGNGWEFSEDENDELSFSKNIKEINISNIISNTGDKADDQKFENLVIGENDILINGLEPEKDYTCDAELVLFDEASIGKPVKIIGINFSTKLKKVAPTLQYSGVITNQIEQTADEWQTIFNIDILPKEAINEAEDREIGTFQDIDSINWTISEISKSGDIINKVDEGTLNSPSIEETNTITSKKLRANKEYKVDISATPKISTGDISPISFKINTGKNKAAETYYIEKALTPNEDKNKMDCKFGITYGNIYHQKNIKNVWISNNGDSQEFPSTYDQNKSTVTTTLTPGETYNFTFHFEVNDDTNPLKFSNPPLKINAPKLLAPEIKEVKILGNIKKGPYTPGLDTSFNVETEFENINNIKNAKVKIFDLKSGKIISEKKINELEFNQGKSGSGTTITNFDESDGIKQGKLYLAKVSFEEIKIAGHPKKNSKISDKYWTDNSDVKVINEKASLDKGTKKVSVNFSLINYKNAKDIILEIKNKNNQTVFKYETNDITSSNISKTFYIDEDDEPYSIKGLTLVTTVKQVDPKYHGSFEWRHLKDHLIDVPNIKEIYL